MPSPVLGSTGRRLLPQRSSLVGWVRTAHPGGITEESGVWATVLILYCWGDCRVGHGVRGRENQGGLSRGAFLFKSFSLATWSYEKKSKPLSLASETLPNLAPPVLSSSPLPSCSHQPKLFLSLGHIASSHTDPPLHAVPSALPLMGHSYPSFNTQLKCLPL